MNGDEFYQFLRNLYNFEGQHIQRNRYFIRWLQKPDGTFSFQFGSGANIKAIPRAWLVEAKNAMNNDIVINAHWFNNHFQQNNNNDCRAQTAIWLLNNHN